MFKVVVKCFASKEFKYYIYNTKDFFLRKMIYKYQYRKCWEITPQHGYIKPSGIEFVKIFHYGISLENTLEAQKCALKA